MKNNRIVTIGGTACGPKAAARARRCDPGAEITLIEQGTEVSQATCGLPYYVSGVIRSPEAMVARRPDYFRKVMNVRVMTATRATAIDVPAHKVRVLNLADEKISEIEYDKLVLATGGLPFVPEMEGSGLKGIFTLSKIADAVALREFAADRKIREVAVVGAGLIGLEMAEAFVKMRLKVTLIEALDWVLPKLLDYETAAYLQKHLLAQGVDLRCGQKAIGFTDDGRGRVSGVVTSQKTVPAGLVLLALGVKPNVTLAQEAGLSIGRTGGIAVNEYLETSDPDIYAGGDCVENTNLLTQIRELAPMGSTANKHGRVIGSNITGGREVFRGILGTSVAKVFEYNVARTGLSETQARQEGYDVVTTLVPGDDHAGYYPGGQEILIKLVANGGDGRVLGAQVLGPGEAAKRIDVVAAGLTLGAKADDLAGFDLAYAPPYNSALDPLHHAANTVRNKISGQAQALSPGEVKRKLDYHEDFMLLDVRSKKEWQSSRIGSPQTVLIPLDELRNRLSEIPQDKAIVVYCRSSVRAYLAQRILNGAGFTNVRFMDGSLRSWPFKTVGKEPSNDTVIRDG